MSTPITILLVDDHELVRTGLKALLEKDPALKVIGEASSGEQALKLVREKHPNIVLMDIKMPGMGGVVATQRLVRSLPDVKVIAVTSYGDGLYPEQLIGNTGASGFLTKDCAAEELITAIHKVHQGEVYLGAKIAQQLAIRSVTQSKTPHNTENSSLRGLSERELQVLLMIVSGLRVADISQKLSITPKTVNTYRYRLFDKLHVNSDVELTLLAIRHGLVDVETTQILATDEHSSR